MPTVRFTGPGRIYTVDGIKFMNLSAGDAGRVAKRRDVYPDAVEEADVSQSLADHLLATGKFEEVA
jgi:hypothetical protein